jgi:hypothetical protein
MEYPKFVGEKAWLIQAIADEKSFMYFPVKLIIVGIASSVNAIISNIISGFTTVRFERSIFNDLHGDKDDRYFVRRIKTGDSPFVVAVLNSATKSHRLITMDHIEDRLLRDFKNAGIPFVREWCKYMVPNLKDELVPLMTFNVQVKTFLLYLPSTDEIYEKLLMPHIRKLHTLIPMEVNNG